MDIDKVRLGKKDYKKDARTLQARSLLETVIPDVPNRFDLSKGRRPMPLGLWGNDAWGDCVKVSKYNQIVRLARLDQRRTLPITTEMVVNEYMAFTGARSPGDQHDTGIVILDDFRDWKNKGLAISVGKKATFDAGILAYGEVNPLDRMGMRAGCYALGGIQFGLALPWTAAEQIKNGEPWDDTGSNSNDADPGSWGGHCVYSFIFDENGWSVVTWGKLQRVTDKFMARYADESWVVVDKIKGKYWLPQNVLDSYFKSLHAQSVG